MTTTTTTTITEKEKKKKREEGKRGKNSKIFETGINKTVPHLKWLLLRCRKLNQFLIEVFAIR